ncbi:DUF3899 domain-containing protein [Paenibacillus sp. BSR1-1]|uniref:DUF3899 domain-containing protein n=1 Tax=Paenibacillus sp. BSR1-1 TaxID=3020845 RepID=UPI0025AFA3E4|nr:DUF3899 domain-containing protein [Paenibacillus sp. BSR1-1]MDN3015078.1 DUF3899 domain-containing protein [Paenibacillus sp. BSR1-1]
MKLRLRKQLIMVAFTQLAIFSLSFIFNHDISLLSYINISFYISAAFLLTALLLYTIHSGFYDVISRSFTLAFSRGHRNKKFSEIPGLSELVTVNQKPLLFIGLVNGFLMLLALFAYYFLLT